jgi:hypothetical protein
MALAQLALALMLLEPPLLLQHQQVLALRQPLLLQPVPLLPHHGLLVLQVCTQRLRSRLSLHLLRFCVSFFILHT